MKHLKFRNGAIDVGRLNREGLYIAPARNIPIFNGALVLTRREYRLLQGVNLTIARSLQRAAEYALERLPALVAAACSHDSKKLLLVRADPCTKLPWSVMARLDTVWEGGWPRMLEYNSGMVEGWSYIHLIQQACYGEVHRRPWLLAEALPSPIPLVWGAFLQVFKERFGQSKVPVTAVLFRSDDPVKSVEAPVFAKTIRDWGYTVVLASPEELELRGREAWVRGKRVNLIFKCFGTRDCPESVERICLHPLDYDCVALPHTRQTVMGLKFTMAILSDPQFEGLFEPGDIGTLRRTVPWTRIVAEDRTTDPEGLPCNLVDYTVASRDCLVIKESSGSSGKMVYLGWQTSQEEWEALVERALTEESWVVQKKVTLPRSSFDGEIASWDCDPYYFLGSVGPIVNRFSDADILNVFQGGALCPVMRRIY